ncbi:MAG TPA: M20/M25/M40 family metallo-hydrolase, partial [Candidatus Baltobacteraceae bacterium]|nr:M20/M25/M40 family metallo-hydrolase [Candidatus Baltobacteraceae bacterium]
MLACLVPLPAAADPAFDAQTLQDCARIQAAALGDDYAYRELAGLTDQVGARLSGSPGAQAGVEYVAAAMRSLGAEVRLEPLRVPHWVRGPEGGALTAYPGQQFGIRAPLALTTLGMSVATPGEGIDAEVVVVADFAALHGLAPSAVRGKIVLFDYHFDERLAQAGFAGQAYGEAVRYRAFGPSEAAKLGAVAAVVRSVGGADFRLPHTGALVYADGVPRIPAAALAAEDADRITRLSAQGPVRMHLLLQPRRLPDADSFNVIADLRGSEHPEAVVIVSGHLDSWDLATGATDDGAGVAMAMQTLHTIHALGLKPRRTIRFIAWMNEENGGRG